MARLPNLPAPRQRRQLQALPPGPLLRAQPLGRNLYPNPHGIDAFLPWSTINCTSWREEESWEEDHRLVPEDSFQPFYRWCYKKQALDLEKEGLWPELLDSGKIEICVSAWWANQEASVCLYELIVQLLNAKQAKLHHFSPRPIHQGTTRIPFKTNHVFSNLKKGVCFVSLEHWIWDMGFLPEDYGIIVPKASVIVRVCQP